MWAEPSTRRDGTMPKFKTHSGAKKRFKVTGTGKVIHDHAMNVHKFQEKSGSRKRRVSMDAVLAAPDAKRVKKLLGK
jgi:large subunit ribosomal protein L35